MSRWRRRKQTTTPQDNRRVDLHMHSFLSDGKQSPEALLARASERKLDIMAITDHDIPPSLEAKVYHQERHPVRLIHGVELSVSFQDTEQHFLAYFPHHMPEAFRKYCTKIVRARATRYDDLRESIGLSGVEPADQAAKEGKRALTRLHLAQAIVAAGHASYVSQVFTRWLRSREESSHFPDAIDCIHKVKEHGGICIWAHPPINKAALYAEKLKEEGLDGLEVFRPYRKKNEIRRLRSLCTRLDLLRSGGSDAHDDSVGLFSFPAQEISAWPASFSFQSS